MLALFTFIVQQESGSAMQILVHNIRKDIHLYMKLFPHSSLNMNISETSSVFNLTIRTKSK